MKIVVDCAAGILRAADRVMPCAIGRSGSRAATEKHEGDGCTPTGLWPIRAALLRPDRAVPPPSLLPWRWIRREDGWSDDPADPDYNRPVRHPHRFSAERMWRSDGLYDVALILGHNDAPPAPGRGSAIFLHIRSAGPTEGCLAIEMSDMAILLTLLSTGDTIDIR